ncbi:GNAT family N-acetyltransferase [Microbulbifer yueqingensis]|uniref:Acetyltransferase (GNAT) family protein n=1 Tax=Microbulbifer yueqingensis TaxID=658219 RepID=A0A1G8ZT67_9GAMM|nr:GNAT family N-acetyltransferase [Microbulbifer yueqingensis]SDK18322.1 Acetyltransferase (GNAT) family protein [Microbulbifer yueqingensis]
MSEDKHRGDYSQPVTVELRDGQVVKIRPMTRDDKELEREFITNLSPESRHERFLGGVGKPSERMLDQLTDIDHDLREAFIATIPGVAGETEIGVSRYALEPERKVAECAVVVADDWQKKGLGTVLLNRLVETARTRGIQRLYSVDSAQNHKLQEVARAMGWECHTDPHDSAQVIYSFDLGVG